MIPEDIINMFKHSLKRPKEPSAQWPPKSAVAAVLETVPSRGKQCCPRHRVHGVRGFGFRRVKRQFCVQILVALKESGAYNSLSLSFPVCKNHDKKCLAQTVEN